MNMRYVPPDPAIEAIKAIRANSGAYMSRTRQERVRSSLLGQDDGFITCPRRIRIGLAFEGTNPVACMESIMVEEGIRSVDELRSAFELPATRLICRVQPNPVVQLNVAHSPRLDVLEQALWLGLCTAQLFDPSRPVLWTDTSLNRKLELFDLGGYYA